MHTIRVEIIICKRNNWYNFSIIGRHIFHTCNYNFRHCHINIVFFTDILLCTIACHVHILYIKLVQTICLTTDGSLVYIAITAPCTNCRKRSISIGNSSLNLYSVGCKVMLFYLYSCNTFCCIVIAVHWTFVIVCNADNR